MLFLFAMMSMDGTQSTLSSGQEKRAPQAQKVTHYFENGKKKIQINKEEGVWPKSIYPFPLGNGIRL